MESKSGLTSRIESRVAVIPPVALSATMGTVISATNMRMPWATSVRVAPRNPPNSVYSSVTPATMSMPVRKVEPKEFSKNTPPATMPEET